MQLVKPSAAALLAAVAMAAPATANEQDAETHPHELPTFSGDKPAFHAPEKPPRPGELPDARGLYDRALACWPVPSFFRAEVNLEGRIRSDRNNYIDDTGAIRGADRYGVALVARIPLYSSMELDREREREYARRTKLADAVGAFIAILAERQKNQRELQLMRALERRAQERVKIGVTETGEQVGFLEKVAAIEGTLLQQRGQIEKSRLALIGHCAPSQADALDTFIAQYMPRY